MKNLNKVIAGLECCLDEERDCKSNCPYYRDEMGCMDDLLAAALEILRGDSGDWIRLSDLMKFPIRIDHYDKEQGNEHFVYGVETVLEYAENLPRVEAEPVVHAHWELGDVIGLCKCSACGWPDNQTECRLRCSYCGAHMDEEVADGIG
jgi:hypothetical protein